MSKKLTKADRQLVIQHVLAIAGRDLTNEEIINATGTSGSRLKGDLFGLRNDSSTNVEMVEKDGLYTHEYTGSIEFLDSLPSEVKLNLDGLKLKKDSSSKKPDSAIAVKKEKNKDTTKDTVKYKAENTVLAKEPDTNSDIELRSIVAKCLTENKKKLTIIKISENISQDKELVEDELNLMVKDGVANSTYVAAFQENVFGSTVKTKKAIITEVKKPEKVPTETVVEKAPVASKITIKIKESILLVLEDDGISGGKGKNGLIKIIYDAIKGLGVPRHDIEDLISGLIESKDLVESGKDGRGVKYISASYLANVKELEEQQKAESNAKALAEKEAPVTEAPVTEAPVTEAPVTEAPVTEAPITEAPVTEAEESEAVVGDFNINALVEDLEETMKKDNIVLGPSISKLLSEVGLHIERLEAENKKWRGLAKLFVNGIKSEFN